MRKKVRLTIVFVVILPAMFFSASCAKREVLQTDPLPTTQPQVSKEPDRSAEEAEQLGRLQEDRLQIEAGDRMAAEMDFLNENVHFAFDGFVLSEQARQVLKSKAEYLRANPVVKVTIEGHCDERGTDAYNIALAERRAESVKDFLVNLGISDSRLNTISYGEERPIAKGHDEVSWAKNRRAQFVIN